jgi:hypothetical protein
MKESLVLSIDSVPATGKEAENLVSFSLKGKSQKEKVKLLILRDLLNVNWSINFKGQKIEVSPPKVYDKSIIKEAMSVKRAEIINSNRKWIDKHLPIARANIAKGIEVLYSKIEPVIEVCTTQKQHDLFRIFRYYWSSPYSEYVGRRIKLLIRDKALPNRPIIGIAALGSPIIHIPERDEFIGWDVKTRTKNLIYTLDAYVIGAIPPYNYLLGGKLISYLMASEEVRKIYQKKYKNVVTIIEKRTANNLYGIFTTSLYGKSAQYNRLKYNDILLYKPIGKTKGFGSLHLSKETIIEMVKLLRAKKIVVNHKFGDGPSWVMRVINAAGEILGFDPECLLRHSFQRDIYFVPIAKNYRQLLNGLSKKPEYYGFTKRELTEHWKNRWYSRRRNAPETIAKLLNFEPENFIV